MKSTSPLSILVRISLIVTAVTIAGILQGSPETRNDAAASRPMGTQFNTPKEAADALIAAAGSYDTAALKEILGPGSDDIVSSQDAVADKNGAMAFVAKAKEKTEIGTDPKNRKRAIPTIGSDQLEVPIPIIEHKGKWSFDNKVGREEILNCRIGANELDAIALCRGYVEAQHEHGFQEKHDDSKVNQYAQHIISIVRKTRRAGLAESGWHLGRTRRRGDRARDRARLHRKSSSRFAASYFKALKGQGPAARMGQMDFVVENAMIAGFAPRGCAGAISRHGREELHRRPGRHRLRKGFPDPTPCSNSRRWMHITQTRAGKRPTTTGATKAKRRPASKTLPRSRGSVSRPSDLPKKSLTERWRGYNAFPLFDLGLIGSGLNAS